MERNTKEFILTYLESRVREFERILIHYGEKASEKGITASAQRDFMEAYRLNCILRDEFKVSLEYIRREMERSCNRPDF